VPRWAGLVDQHSSVRVGAQAGDGVVRWENLPGFDARGIECEFRRSVLAALLEVDPARIEHRECRALGEPSCRFVIAGLVPELDEAHDRLLRESTLLCNTLQGREAVFRRLSALAPGGAPLPDIRDVRAIRRFMEELEDAVLVLGRNLWVLDANCVAVELFGMSLDQLRGQSARGLLSPDSYRDLGEALPELYSKGSIRGLQLEGVARGGAVALEVSGRVSGSGDTLVFIARDVGEHLHLERELEQRNRQLREQNERIAEADQLKSEFLANVSHELTTPLTCIKGFSRLLYDDVREEAVGGESKLDLERRLEFLEIMQQEAERVLGLIRGLLELSTLESGAVALDRARVSLNTVVRECLLLLKPRVDERGLDVVVQLDESMPLALLDPNRTKQVVLNLLENAIKFTPPGHEIRVRTYADPECIRLFVRNPSGDLDEADLGRIFDRFVQRDGSFARQHGGVGLGLNLVRAIVELHGGRVWAELLGDAQLQLCAELPVQAG
jgi:signal transduction histidine kinase